jgi:hypothetical protein
MGWTVKAVRMGGKGTSLRLVFADRERSIRRMSEPKRFRAFTPEFVAYMDRRGGWPDLERSRDKLRKLGRENKRDYISRIRHGKYVPMKYVTFYLEMLLEAEGDKHFAQCRLALGDYLRDRGFETLDPRLLERVAPHCCTAILDKLPGDDDSDGVVDWIIQGLGSLSTFPLDLFFKSLITHCQAGDPDRVALWTYLMVARERLPEGPHLTPEAAQAAAGTIIGVPFPEYVQRARRWAKANPWTILHALRKGQQIGGSIILPVYPHIYAEIRAGARKTSDVEPEHICVPSNWIVIESVCENPDTFAEGHNPTRAILYAMVVQHGALMRLGNPAIGRVYRFLAPEGTSRNRERMLAAGFKPTETVLANGVRLWERLVDFDTGVGAHIFDEGAMSRLAKQCESAPPLPP